MVSTSPLTGAIHRSQRGRLFLADGLHRLGQLTPNRVGRPAGDHLVQDHPQRVDVAARIDLRRVAQQLLRAHVGQRPDQLTDVGLQRRVRVGVGEPRHAEIEDVGLARFVHQDVGGLEIAMDDRALVRVLDAVANLRHQLQPLPQVEPVRVAVGKQRLPVHQLHGEVRLAPKRGVGHPRVVDLRDAGVLQPAQRLRLVLEAAEHLAGGISRADHLQGHGAMRELLLRLVDRAHPALTEQANDAIPPNPRRQCLRGVGQRRRRAWSGCAGRAPGSRPWLVPESGAFIIGHWGTIPRTEYAALTRHSACVPEVALELWIPASIPHTSVRTVGPAKPSPQRRVGAEFGAGNRSGSLRSPG